MKTEWCIKKKITFLIGAVGVIAGVVLIFKHIFPLVAPFVLGFLIAIILERPVKWLAARLGQRMTLASVLVAVLVGLAIVTVLVLVLRMMCQEIEGFMQNIDSYRSWFLEKMNFLCGCADRFLGLDKGMSIGFLTKNIDNMVGRATTSALPSVVSMSVPVVSALAGIFAGVMVTFFSMIYFGRDLDNLRSWRAKSIFNTELFMLSDRLKMLGHTYFRVQGIIILLNVIVCIVGLTIIGNPYNIVLGLIIGVFDALPFWGTGTVLIPWGVVELIMGSPGRAAVLYTTYLVTYLLREILEGRLMGKSLGIAPLTMLFSIYVGLLVYGLTGFILGPVSYCIIKELILYLKKLIECDKIKFN